MLRDRAINNLYMSDTKSHNAAHELIDVDSELAARRFGSLHRRSASQRNPQHVSTPDQVMTPISSAERTPTTSRKSCPLDHAALLGDFDCSTTSTPAAIDPTVRLSRHPRRLELPGENGP